MKKVYSITFAFPESNALSDVRILVHAESFSKAFQEVTLFLGEAVFNNNPFFVERLIKNSEYAE